jgi:ubiquinone/menaquinone biosynthesis C-methylase UbiE
LAKDIFDQKAREWDNRPMGHEMAAVFASQIRGNIPLSAEMRLLEFGCGTGQVSLQLCSEVSRVLMVDTSAGMMEVLAEKIRDQQITNMELYCGDLSGLPLAEAQLDLIYTLMALHHVPAIVPLLQRFHQLLKPGGRLCIGDLEPEDGLFHDAGLEVHPGFELTELERNLQKCGFSVTAAHRMHLLSGKRTSMHSAGCASGMRDYPLKETFFLAA